ncbi:MAG: hypothetical protein Q9191_006126 [Dirinaria sp. TL-2023a]
MAHPPAASNHLSEFYEKVAQSYESLSGGTTRAVAAMCISYLGPLPPDARVLDNACGPGMGGDEVLKVYPGASVDMVDTAQAMVDFVRCSARENERWKGRVNVALMDGTKLGFEAETFNASITNFGIFLFNTPAEGAKEIYRTLKRGGRAAITSWKFAGWADLLLREIMDGMFPEKEKFVMPVMEQWREKDTLVNCMADGGFSKQRIRVEEMETAMWFREKEFAQWREAMAETMRSMVGDRLDAEVKARLEEGLSMCWEDEDKRRRLFIKGQEGMAGVRMVAWMGIGTK